MDDLKTINAVLTGNKDRFADLVDRYQRLVYAIAWSRLGDCDLAEDAAQETFVKAYQYLGGLRQRNRFGWWIGRIARNVSSSYGFRRSRELEAAQQFASSEREGDKAHGDTERVQSFWQAFSSLNAAHRESLSLYYIEGRSIVEAASVAGISESAMKVRLHRARLALREGIEVSIEEQLETVQPGAQFTRSVMAILPTAPLGGLSWASLAIFAKLGLAVSSLLFMTVAYLLAIEFGARMMSRVPVSRSKRFATPLSILFAALLTVLAIVFVMTFGADLIWKVLALALVLSLIQTVMRFKINPLINGWWFIGATCLQAAPLVGFAFFHLPFMWFMITGLLASFIAIPGLLRFASGPRRIDYNLFVRAATHGLGAAESVTADSTLLNKTLLKRFAILLGRHWLIQDYQVKDDTMVLWLSPALPGLFSGYRKDEQSYVTVHSSGSCKSQISGSETRYIETLTRGTVPVIVLAKSVEDAVAGALIAFASNDIEGAQRRLAVTRENQRPQFSRRERNLSLGLGVLLGLITALCIATMFVPSEVVRQIVTNCISHFHNRYW